MVQIWQIAGDELVVVFLARKLILLLMLRLVAPIHGKCTCSRFVFLNTRIIIWLCHIKSLIRLGYLTSIRVRCRDVVDRWAERWQEIDWVLMVCMVDPASWRSLYPNRLQSKRDLLMMLKIIFHFLLRLNHWFRVVYSLREAHIFLLDMVIEVFPLVPQRYFLGRFVWLRLPYLLQFCRRMLTYVALSKVNDGPVMMIVSFLNTLTLISLAFLVCITFKLAGCQRLRIASLFDFDWVLGSFKFQSIIFFLWSGAILNNRTIFVISMSDPFLQ